MPTLAVGTKKYVEKKPVAPVVAVVTVLPSNVRVTDELARKPFPSIETSPPTSPSGGNMVREGSGGSGAKGLAASGREEDAALSVALWVEGLGDVPRTMGLRPVSAETSKSERIPTARSGPPPERLLISLKKRPQIYRG